MTNESKNSEPHIDKVVLKVFENTLSQLGISHCSVDYEVGSKKGDNYLGIIVRARVKGVDQSGGSISKSFIIKCAHTTEGYRKLDVLEHGYKRETYVYSTLLPFFQKFQKEREILEPFESYPQFYASCSEYLHEALIFEDMVQQDYVMESRLKPLSEEHCLIVVKELGKWHALSLALKDQEPQTYKKIRTECIGKFVDRITIEDYLINKTKKVASVFNPITQKIELEKYKEITNNLVDDIFFLLDAEAAEGYEVILHGDCWMNNMLYQYKDSKNKTTPSKVCFLDWQLLRVGSPAIDLLYFLYICTDKNTRDKYFENIIKFYHNSMTNFLKELGSDIEKLYPEKKLKEDLKKFSKWGLAAAHLLVPMMVSEIDDIPDIVAETATGKEFHDVLANSTAPERALRRLQECFLHMYENNLL